MLLLPDKATLQLCSFIASTAFGLVFLVIWKGRRAERFWLFWAASFLLYAATMPVFALVRNGAAVTALVGTLALTNVLILAGIRSFDGRPPFPPWMLVPVAATALGFGLPLLLTPDAGTAWTLARIGGFSMLAASCAFVGASLVSERVARASYGRRLAGLSMLGYLPGYVLGILAEGAGWSESNLAVMLPLLSDQVLLGVLSLGLLAMPGERAQAALREAAARDALTGAWNRAGLEARAGRLAPGTAVILIDVDHFKGINDRYGHAAGDAVLVALVARIVGLLPGPRDLVARLGGDEFVVVLHDTTLPAARGIAERIRGGVRGTADGVRWTVSLGVALAPGPGLAEALARADTALYAAKEAGRDRAA